MFAPRAVTLMAICLIVFALDARAGELVNKDGADLAIKGYDPVAYFTEGRPIAGVPEFEQTWHDAVWRFSSAEHLRLFARDPERYAPRYGGFCAGAMANGWKVTVDPEAWTIIDGKLYLSFRKDLIKRFAQDPVENVAKADANWQRIGHSE
ncbi:YHS domain-containing (seleno)protein [Pelagibius sp.]|uniref:YHS domain-containing (seleno)protein n=1 Tax=Pelagibius sp. TaxID=1931238 RepID=UPI00261EAB35|nr:YHS domain-containing (seleno)protein [Pelagibius sp.]